jgi:predicted DNA-binding WGR domain protein
MPNYTEANDHRVLAAIAAEERLHLGVTLSYCGGGSDKFWTGVWAEDKIAVNFGRHGSEGQTQMQAGIRTAEQGAKKMWDLLRTKVGKGYTVVDAAIIIVPPLSPTSQIWSSGNMISAWNRVRDARAMNPRRPLDHPELLGKSRRTPTEGAQVLLTITQPKPDLEALMAGAVADPTERFLPPIVMSRPDVPEEAKFLAALSGTAKVFM